MENTLEKGKEYPRGLARGLILDELFDLMLYQRLLDTTSGWIRQTLLELIEIEKQHVAFWQDFFEVHVTKLTVLRKIKLELLILFARIFRSWGSQLVLESIEIYGVRKYLRVWEKYEGTPLGQAVERVIEDELKHEADVVTTAAGRKVVAERIRVIFLGFNDGLVELLGAVSGFFVAFGSVSLVLVAGFTVAIAGAISMAAGVYVASSAEQEVERTERRKKAFMKREKVDLHVHVRPMSGAITVGIAYLIGAFIPLLPVFFGGTNILWSVVISAIMIVIISLFLSFISGMRVWRRILMNLGIIAFAVIAAYLIGSVVSHYFGVSV